MASAGATSFKRVATSDPERNDREQRTSPSPFYWRRGVTVRRDMLGGAAARGVMVAGCPVSKAEQTAAYRAALGVFGDVKPKVEQVVPSDTRFLTASIDVQSHEAIMTTYASRVAGERGAVVLVAPLQ